MPYARGPLTADTWHLLARRSPEGVGGQPETMGHKLRNGVEQA